jgi:hypothetical protein
MDPDEALRRLRDDAIGLRTHAIDAPALTSGGDWERVVAFIDQFRDLDEWLFRGGFLPDAWHFAQRRAEPVPGTEEA